MVSVVRLSLKIKENRTKYKARFAKQRVVTSHQQQHHVHADNIQHASSSSSSLTSKRLSSSDKGIYGGIMPVPYSVANIRDANKWDDEENLIFKQENEALRLVMIQSTLLFLLFFSFSPPDLP
jgi:hypothetical protein